MPSDPVPADDFDWSDIVEPRPLGDPLAAEPRDGEVPADLRVPVPGTAR
jgi:hypothetical protein